MSTRTLWIAYLVLLLLSIPWYFPHGTGAPIVGGFPLWALISLACYVAAAALTVWRIDAAWEADPNAAEPPES